MRTIPRHSLKRGATLIAVFWIMAIMGLALVATMKIARYQSEVAGSQLNGIEARQYAEMGINLAANPGVEIWDPILRQSFDNGTGFQAKILSEGGRFNINYILYSEDKVLLRRIFDHWGIDFDVASEIADALTDWFDPDEDVSLNGAEYGYYEGQGHIDRPFNRPFYKLEEMSLVRGMDIVEAANPRWREWFTVWSSGGLDVNEASAQFLAIAADVDIEDAVQVVQASDGEDGIRDTEDDDPIDANTAMEIMGVFDESGVIQKRLAGEDQVNRIESIGFAGPVRRKVVLVIKNRSQSPQILDRREEIIK